MKEPHISSIQVWGGLDLLYPPEQKILQVGDGTFGVTNSPVSNTLLRAQRAQSVYSSMFQRPHSDLYSFLPYLNGPYHLSSSNEFMSQSWLNKNAERRCRPWPLTSLKHTYKCRANNYLSCHSKCSARQRSWLTCYSMPIFSHPMSCARSFKSKLLQPFILLRV